MIKDLLLTHQQMADRYKELSKTNLEGPYFYKITNGKQALYYIGANHSYDPNNFQYDKIRNYWKEFLKETGRKNSIVLVEGGKRQTPKPEKDFGEDDAIKEGGEADFITYLAFKEGIETESPEPDDEFELKELNKNFSLEEILYHRFVRTADQWNRLSEPKPDFWEYVERFINRDKKSAGRADFATPKELFIKLHNEHHPDHPFNEYDQKCFHNDSNPSIEENKVASASSIIRNVHITKEIVKLWQEGKNIFVVYGSGHAIVQEKALQKLLI